MAIPLKYRPRNKGEARSETGYLAEKQADILNSLTVGNDQKGKVKHEPVFRKGKYKSVTYQVIYDYLAHLKATGKAESYIKGSKRILLRYIVFLNRNGITDISKVDRQVWHSYANHIYKTGISKATLAEAQSTIRCLYRYLAREELIASSPFKNFQSPKLDKLLPKVLTIKEAETLMDFIISTDPIGLRDRAMLEVLYATGIRVSELANLNLGDINFSAREAFIRNGKGSKDRYTLFGIPASEALMLYILGGRPTLLNWEKTNALFLNSHSQRITRDSVRQIVKRYGIEAIGKDIYPHILRHSFATHMLEGGADLRVIQELMGHSLLTTTQIYTHISNTQLKSVYLSCHPLAGENNL